MTGPGYLTECWCGDVRVSEPEGTTPVPGTNGQRGEGQGALGYREPLNKNEENKRNDDGLNVRQRIVDIYSRYGFDSIDPADLRGRFRWYGLYTQRRPGIDGAHATIAHLAARWQARAGWFAVRPAYASAASPDPAAAVTSLLRGGARRVVVATYLLAPGYFADRIRDSSLAAGAAAVSPVLGASAEVADVLLDRFRSPAARRVV
jgi:hypothetical protein